jgi:hypothetical protein
VESSGALPPRRRREDGLAHPAWLERWLGSRSAPRLVSRTSIGYVCGCGDSAEVAETDALSPGRCVKAKVRRVVSQRETVVERP